MFYICSIEDFYLGALGWGWRIIKSNYDWVDFHVTDDTGKVAINPEGAEISLKEIYHFTALPFKKIPERVKKLLRENKIKENLRLISLPKVFRVKEYIVEEGGLVQIIGSTQSINRKTLQALPQSEKLIVTRKAGF